MSNILTVSIIKDKVIAHICVIELQSFNEEDTFDLFTHSVLNGRHIYTKSGVYNKLKDFYDIFYEKDDSNAFLYSFAGVLINRNQLSRTDSVIFNFSNTGYELRLNPVDIQTDTVYTDLIDDRELLMNKYLKSLPLTLD